jgi:hypothetical protein
MWVERIVKQNISIQSIDSVNIFQLHVALTC